MIIDFEKLPEVVLTNHFGGHGPMYNRTFLDEKNAITRGIIPPGSTSGYHPHEDGCEILYVLKGELRFKYDDGEETVRAGQVQYCPSGHSHQMFNDTDEDCEFFSCVINRKVVEKLETGTTREI